MTVKYQWRFAHLTEGLAGDESLASAIRDVFLDGFGLSRGWALDKVQRRLRTSNALGVLIEMPESRLCGYALYSVPRRTHKGLHVLWEDGICIRKVAQGLGLTKPILSCLLSMYPDYRFGWFGGRTQNPLIMKRYSALGWIYPFDETYSTTAGSQLLDYLRRNVAEVHEVDNLDMKCGICRGVYSEGILGDYSLQIPGTASFESRLQKWGFDRKAGDAVIVIAQLPSSTKAILLSS